MDELDASGKSDMAGEPAAVGGRRARKAGGPQNAERAFAGLTEVPLAEASVVAASDVDPVWPERKYSFNALVAVGVAGFVMGRLLSR